MALSFQEASALLLQQQAINWLVRLRADDFSEAEMMAFAAWLAKDHAHSEAFAAAESLFSELVLAAKSPAPDISVRIDVQDNAPIVKLPPQRSAAKRYRRWLTTTLAIAAVWLFVVMLVMPQQAPWLDNYLSDYHTETGELRAVQLADGSQVLLNTNSAVSVDFNASVRQVTLHYGQARFTVAKDTQRPFQVRSDNLIVKALGTVFEVYQHPGEVSVTVQEHAVLASVQAEASVPVQQGQQLNYRSGGPLTKPETVELNQTSAWQQQRLFINDRPLGELLDELGRYRVGRVFLSDEKLKNLRVTGVFSLDKPDEVLSSVVNALNLQETRLGPWWVLLHR
jgi:transmembrane sensor